jgi:hypothetical protein
VCPRSRPVHHDAEGFDLGWRPLVAQDDGDFGDTQLAGGLQPQMAIHHFAVTADQTGDLETKLAKAAAHLIHSRVILARVAGVKDQLIDWPQ